MIRVVKHKDEELTRELRKDRSDLISKLKKNKFADEKKRLKDKKDGKDSFFPMMDPFAMQMPIDDSKQPSGKLKNSGGSMGKAAPKGFPYPVIYMPQMQDSRDAANSDDSEFASDQSELGSSDDEDISTTDNDDLDNSSSDEDDRRR